MENLWVRFNYSDMLVTKMHQSRYTLIEEGDYKFVVVTSLYRHLI